MGDDAEFTQAVSTILMYKQKDDEEVVESANSNAGSSNDNSGGSLENLFRSGQRNGMFGMNNMGTNNMGMNNVGMNNMGMNNMGVNNMGMNNMGTNNMGMNNMGNNMMGNNMMGNNMNNMQNMMLMNQLNSGSNDLGDVGEVFSNQIRQQQMQQVQQYADQNQAAMCTQVPAHDRNAAQREHTGSMMRDMAMCQAKGGCFDALMWDYVDQENKKIAEVKAKQSNSRGSNLFSSSGFSSNSPFRRGKRSV